MSVTAGASLALDRRAMALLESLQEADPEARARCLDALATTDPPLHARVAALVRAEAGDSQVLAAPLLAGMATLAAAGETLAGWRLLRVLGRGGMAEVWLAERSDGGLARKAALKRPLAPGGPAGRLLAERFARERDVLAALDHPHIARLFDAGVAADDQAWLVLEYVDGLPITRFAAEVGLSMRGRIELFMQVLAAVDHAHRHLVVHRDLKPANILVTPDGQAKLLDFGIAKLLAPAPGAATLTQGAVMTPMYAAPEQVLGQPVSTACDVYSAGVVLYELLTGRMPFALMNTADPTVPQLMHTIAEAEPEAPGLGVELDTVLLKALHKAPQERYASIERFSEDLRRVLADEPILARRVPAWRRAWLLARRHRRGSLAAAAGVVALSATAGLAWQQHLATREQAARTAAVRDFMFTLVGDAEPDETSPGGQVTGRQIVDAAVQRARREFARAPVLQGEVLVELGRMYSRLGTDGLALDTLREGAAILERAGPPGEPTLHKARGHLSALVGARDAAAGRVLAERVLTACRTETADCAMARLYARTGLAQIDAAGGDFVAAIAQAKQAVAESRRAFGGNDLSTAESLEALAVLQRNRGQLAAAVASIDEAATIAGATTARASTRSRLQRTQATLRLDGGHHAEAAASFERLATAERQAGDRALAWRMAARARLALGLPQEALAAADAALQAAEQADEDFERAFAHQERARALSLLGPPAAAEAAFAQVTALLPRAGFDADSAEVRRLARLQAEHAMRQGRADAAAALLDRLLRVQDAAAHPLEQALALDLAGRMAMARGQVQAARGHHARAQALLEPALPATHPLRLRNTLYLLWAEDNAEPARLRAAAAALRSDLPRGSIWQRWLTDDAVLSRRSAEQALL